jgi:aspartyl-tRNA(Asn)/glutamyl-tRNA(Gln) amidotransferase subunit A
MNNILNKTIKEVSEMLEQKKITSLELTKMVFERIKEVEPKIHAFITLTEKEALEQARESDLRIVNGKRLSAIDGIPISIKDVLCTKDIKTTAGSRMLEDFVPPYDATVVKRLKEAGVVIIGKNNCDAWAHGSSTENSDFGPSKNPWDIERVPGGSSGGSAAAVAVNMGFASIGTDTGGSIRQPAAFCGITGLKPTYGRNSRFGLIAMGSSLDCPGIFARSVEDVAIIQEIIGGHDPLDSTTVPNRKFQITNDKLQINSKLQLSNIKIGLPKEYFAKGLDPKIAKKVKEATEMLEKQGATFVEISLPMTEYGLACYYIIQPAEVSSNLARFDGIKYGYSIDKIPNNNPPAGGQISNKSQTLNLKSQTLSDVYNQSRAEGFGAEAKRRIIMGTYVLSAGYYDAYYKKAMKVRTLVIDDFKKAFKNVDAIITPTTPTLPFKFGQKSNDPIQMYLEDIYTVTANIAGIPGISIPCGFVDGLPVGMQILGPQFGEETILRIADEYQKLTDFHLEIPKI